MIGRFLRLRPDREQEAKEECLTYKEEKKRKEQAVQQTEFGLLSFIWACKSP